MQRLLKVIVLTSLVLMPAAAFAQASIVGTVKDASGAVLPGVTVEASSPVLIEKTRSVISSGTGQYAIEDLRPGTYTVTFTLPGFTTVKREGIELTGRFIATVNADLKVGGVQETITVSGEAPIVDVTSARTQQTLSGQTVAEIPTSRLYSAYTQVIPSLNVQGNDVGGSQGNVFSVFQIHGGRRNEGQVLVDGMSGGYQGMGVSSYVPEVGNSQEVVFNLSGGLGEATTGGPQMNIIGKQGGNLFSGSFFVSGSGDNFVGSNLSAAQEAQGLTVPLVPLKLWDVNPSVGGPIIRDKLWFFGTYRYQMNRQSVASMWVNKNAGDPTKWTYAPDLANQAVDDGTWKNGSVRLTWQASPRNKIQAWSDVQYICLHCIEGGSSSGLTFTGLIASPEALQRNENHPNMMTQVTWTSPVTNRLLVEANAQLRPYFWWGSRQKTAFDNTFIPVQDDGCVAGDDACFARSAALGYYIPGINYRSVFWTGHSGFTNVYQGSSSYVTGSHSTKFGIRYMNNDAVYPINYYNNQQLKYNVRAGVPYQLTMYADQAAQQEQSQNFFVAFAQDRWTLGRLSLQGGLRFEHLSDHFPRQQIGPNLFMPTAAVFPEQDGPLKQKDLQPRFGASYDVFGNGRTAVKAFIGRYVTTTNTVNEWLFYSPAWSRHFTSQTTRPWTDLNADFVADCRLLDPVANGECGPMANPQFGKSVNNLTVDPATTSGWNTREYSWDTTVGINQQIAPRVSVEVNYVYRTWGNLQATVNRALTPADFDTFTYTVPQDPKLPGGGGYTLTFKDVKPEKFGIYDNFQTFSNDVGGAYNHFNGIDFTVNARLKNVTIQGGTSSGNVVEDECGVAAQHPDIYISGLGWGGSLNFFTPFIPSIGQWPIEFCHRESGWLTNVKGLASYTVPKIDVLVSTAFHSVPYPGNNFPSVASQSLGGQAIVAPQFQTTLGRPLSSGNVIEFFNIVKPGDSNYDRLSQVDLRVGKNLRYGRTKTLISLDVFNLFNSNTPDVFQQNYSAPSTLPRSTYLDPLSITVPRLFKISAQFDF